MRLVLAVAHSTSSASLSSWRKALPDTITLSSLGTFFQIELPVAQEETWTAARIPVVDDERSVNKLYCQALRGAGYDVCGVFDAEHALQLVGEQRFDVIVLDLPYS